MSSSFINKVLDIFGMGDETDRATDEQIDENESEQIEVISSNRKNKVVSIHSNINAKIAILEPCEYEEITILCDCLKNRKIVIANLHKLDTNLAQRFVDFAGGAAYALDGSIQQVSPGLILITPNSVDVSSELKDELSNRGIFSWAGNR